HGEMEAERHRNEELQRQLDEKSAIAGKLQSERETDHQDNQALKRQLHDKSKTADDLYAEVQAERRRARRRGLFLVASLVSIVVLLASLVIDPLGSRPSIMQTPSQIVFGEHRMYSMPRLSMFAVSLDDRVVYADGQGRLQLRSLDKPKPEE